eukprot:TRINITY_DN29675_c0_g1_i1.p1 TRINITY_DN29675_c0_g1~~TRINITY_DN29675_c0_g1_i1.p1  ORF type:complete len:306 (+),score=33.59 TRINITY_DN29675_c0_g1_i1:154-1071(+)
MGKKIFGLYATLCFLSVILITVSCSSTWHRIKVHVGGLIPTFRMDTSVLSVRIPEGSGFLCKVVPSKTCEKLDEGVSLQHAQQQWCASYIKGVYPQPCTAFKHAYMFGIGVVIGFALDIILLGVSLYLLWHYMSSSRHKPVYRTSASYTHALGTLIMTVIVVLHTVLAMDKLENIGGLGSSVLGASDSVGYAPGYFVMWCGILIQIIAIGLHTCMPLSQEETEDQRMEYEFMKEQKLYGSMDHEAPGDLPLRGDYGYSAPAQPQISPQVVMAPAMTPPAMTPQHAVPTFVGAPASQEPFTGRPAF